MLRGKPLPETIGEGTKSFPEGIPKRGQNCTKRPIRPGKSATRVLYRWAVKALVRDSEAIEVMNRFARFINVAADAALH